MFVLELQSFLFILARITAFIVVVPGFSHKSFPNTSKVALSIILSWVVYVNIPQAPVYQQTLLFMLAVLRETIIGLTMGFIAKMVFSSVEMAGQLVDFQVGYSMGAIYDPATGTTSSYYGKLFSWMSILVFFMLDLHHTLLLTVMESFSVVTAGQLGFGGFNLSGILYIFSYTFKIAFCIAAPMLIVLLVTDIVMGLLSRTVPEINVFMLGMPLKSLIGMVMFLILVSSLMTTTGKTLGLMDDYIIKAVEMFR
jgi:flagellar biosynthesis protein FliR